jgi:hypothetical protein
MRSARVLAALLLLGACVSPIQTRHDMAPDADFSRYHTYIWASHDPQDRSSETLASGSGFVSPLDDRRLREDVDADLQAKGYHKVAKLDEADLVVRYQVGRKEKVRVSQPAGRVTVYSSPYRYGPWYRTSPVEVSTYTEGTLSIEFYDRRSRDAVWVGWAQKRLSKSDDSASLIKRAVEAVLAPLPLAGGAAPPAA